VAEPLEAAEVEPRRLGQSGSLAWSVDRRRRHPAEERRDPGLGTRGEMRRDRPDAVQLALAGQPIGDPDRVVPPSGGARGEHREHVREWVKALRLARSQGGEVGIESREGGVVLPGEQL